MNIEGIANLANSLMMEAQYARWYYDVLRQYDEMRRDHLPEFKVSACFYYINEISLFEALAMRLAKLYDDDTKSANIKLLFSEMRNLLSSGEKVIGTDGKERDANKAYAHRVKEYERCYFADKVQAQEELKRVFAPVFGVSYEVIIEVTAAEMFGMYQKRFSALGAKIKKLIVQRNKMYAHNDKEVDFDFEALEKQNRLFFDDIIELIELAMDLSSFCYELLTGKKRIIRPSQVDDWIDTIRLVKIGLESEKEE